jgi:transposase
MNYLSINAVIGDRNGKHFSCKNCSYKADADVNAALNIAAWGRTVTRPESSTMFCSLHHLVSSKTVLFIKQ